MWAVAKGAFAGLVLLAQPAGAQITSSGPLTQVDPWGVGWLGRNDGALPPTLWDGASALRMDELMSAIDADGLSPAAAGLLRRTLLSSGRGPSGADGALAAARVELLFALGEGAQIVDLKQRFSDEPWATDAAEVRIDRDLSEGRLSQACAEADDFDDASAFGLRLRALCFAAAGETAASELTLELARSSGVDESWLRSALAAVNAPDGPKPAGDYSSGLRAETSLLAGLEPPENAMDFSPPDIAAILAIRSDAPESLRIQAAFDAALAGKLSATAARELLIRPLPEDDEDEGATPIQRSALEQAADLALDPLADAESKAAGLASVLDVEGQSIAAFRLAAQLLAPELAQTPLALETTPYAEVFTRAHLAAGDFDRALEWRRAMEPPPPPEPEPVQLIDVGLDAEDGEAISLLPAADASLAPDPGPGPAPPEPFLYPEWTKARLDAMLLISGADGGAFASADTALRLIAHMDDDTRDETVRILYILAALGKDLPAEARETLAASDAGVGRPVGFGELAALQSAAAAGILGEAALAAIAAIGGDPAAVEAGGFGAVISVLASAGFEDDARALALEALSPQSSL